MRTVVLVKPVLDRRTIAPAPSGRSLRDGQPLLLNPFDRRAVQAALDLRAPGDSVAAIAMGPIEAKGPLAELLPLGVEPTVLLSDPALAGGDLIATITALALAVASLDPDLVIVGVRSTDGEAGLVGPMLAERLDRRFAGPLRRIAREGGRPRLEVTIDSEEGAIDGAVDLPAVVATGEKVAKARAPSPEATAASAGRAVDLRGAGSLGASFDRLGAAGSRTEVVGIAPIRAGRLGLRLDRGSPDEKVAAALAELRGSIPGVDAPPTGAGPTSEDVLIGLASGPDGHPDGRAAELLAAIAEGTGAKPVGYELAAGPMEADGETHGRVDARGVADALEARLDDEPSVAAVLVRPTAFGREVAGRLAARRGLAAISEVVGVRRAPEWQWIKRSFGATALVAVRSRVRPVVVTFGRPMPTTARGAPTTPIVRHRLSGSPADGQLIAARPREEAGPFGDLEAAEIVVVIGTGVGGPEAVSVLAPWTRRPGWALAATRRVVDAGWVPARLQVGLTGRSIAPSIAVLLGVRGSGNHLVGVRSAGRIVAVNPDPAAPVFGSVDVGIVGRWEEIAPGLLDGLTARSNA